MVTCLADIGLWIRFGDRELRQELEQEPELSRIAEKSGIPEEKVRQLLQLSPQVVSLDIPMGEAEEDSLQTLVEVYRFRY